MRRGGNPSSAESGISAGIGISNLLIKHLYVSDEKNRVMRVAVEKNKDGTGKER